MVKRRSHMKIAEQSRMKSFMGKNLENMSINSRFSYITNMLGKCFHEESFFYCDSSNK